MNTQRITRHTHEMLLITFVLLISLSLVGCGGGGGSESTPQESPAPVQTQNTDDNTNTDEDTGTETDGENETVSYEPEATKLEQEASSSQELYVEPEFHFDTFKSLTLDLLVTDYEGQPMANTMIFVSAIEPGVTELDSPKLANKSLITVLKTDSSGAVYRQLEMSQTVTNLLFEINAIGTNNEFIQDISDSSELLLQL